MGFPPAPDAPDLPSQISAGADASFTPGPSGIEICGFALPTFTFSISFSIQLPSFAFPPLFFFAISLKCDLSDPLDVKFGVGGGRVGKTGLNNDPEDA